MRALFLVALVASCTTTPSNVHPIQWSAGTSDSIGEPDPIACGQTVSHPCPWLLFTTTLGIELGHDGTATLTWGDATGGTDPNGLDASHRGELVEAVDLNAGGLLVLPSRGDDGGLRRATTLPLDGGDITWTLFNVAGNTTFHLQIGGAL